MGLNRFYCLCVLAGVCLTNILASTNVVFLRKEKLAPKTLWFFRYTDVLKQVRAKNQSVWPNRQAKVLKRGKVVDLNYDVNGYAVTAKYFGDEVCVAYREKSSIRSSSSRYKRTNQCSSECFRDLEFETYETELVCSQISCGGGRKKLKFVVTDSANGPTIISFAVLTICAVLSSSFAS